MIFIRYLIFDCEVANKRHGLAKICQFGYVLMDDSFGIIEKDNIFINPGNNEDFSNIEQRKIDLDYKENNYSYYYSLKTFNSYKKIIGMFNDESIIKVAFSATNDAYYIECEAVRYNLRITDFKTLDLQVLFCAVLKSKRQLGLDKVMESFNISKLYPEINDLKRHNALGDAYMEYLLLKHLCVNRNIRLDIFTDDDFKSMFCSARKSYKHWRKCIERVEYKLKSLQEFKKRNITKLMFFDIECSNTEHGEGKICEFSYYITDTKMNVLSSKEYLVNPGEGEKYEFKLIGRPKQKDIHLKHEANNYAAYRRAPEFKYIMDNVLRILDDPSTLMLGYNVSSDLAYLKYTFARYGKKNIELQAIDVQAFGELISLSKVATKYCKENLENVQFHNALVDARYTMKVFYSMVQEAKQSPMEYISERLSEKTLCVTKDSLFMSENAIFEQRVKPIFDMLKSEKGDIIDEMKSLKDSCKTEEYISFLSDESNIGKRFGLSFRLMQIPASTKVYEIYISKGYVFSPVTNLTDFIICKDEDDMEFLKGKIPRQIPFILYDRIT